MKKICAHSRHHLISHKVYRVRIAACLMILTFSLSSSLLLVVPWCVSLVKKRKRKKNLSICDTQSQINRPRMILPEDTALASCKLDRKLRSRCWLMLRIIRFNVQSISTISAKRKKKNMWRNCSKICCI